MLETSRNCRASSDVEVMEHHLTRRIAHDLQRAVAHALHIAFEVAAHGEEARAGERLAEESFELAGDRIVLLVGFVSAFGLALDAMPGAGDVDHHGVDAGAEDVILLREPLQHARIVGRPQHMPRRAVGAGHVEGVEFVLDLQRIRRHRGRSGGSKRGDTHLGLFDLHAASLWTARAPSLLSPALPVRGCIHSLDPYLSS